MGATLALPFLEAMVPVRAVYGAAANKKVRLVAIEMVHGSAGSTALGIKKNLWAPAGVGPQFDLGPTSLHVARTVPRLPDDRQQHRRAQRGGVHGAGDRRRPLPLERRVPDAGRIRSRRRVRTSTPARRSIRSTRRSSGRTRRSRRCSCASRTSTRPAAARYGYSCAYTDSISWASPERPLPMTRDPRTVFDQLFGVGATPQERAERRGRGPQHPRLAQHGDGATARRSSAPADRARLGSTISTRCARSSAASRKWKRTTRSGEARELPGRRSACPTRSQSTSS